MDKVFAEMKDDLLLKDYDKFRSFETKGPAREDFLKGLDGVFDKADTNKNGKIDEHELEGLVQGFMAHNGIEPDKDTFAHFFDQVKQHHHKDFKKKELEQFVDHMLKKVIIPACKAEVQRRGLKLPVGHVRAGMDKVFAEMKDDVLLADYKRFLSYETKGADRDTFLKGLDGVFDQADTNKNGKIDEHELEGLVHGFLGANGIEPSPETFSHFFDHVKQHHHKDFKKAEFEKFIDRMLKGVILPPCKAEVEKRGLKV